MKILLLHLSDAHFEDKTYIDENIINAQVQALNSVGDFGKCHIVFSGDIANSGRLADFRVMRTEPYSNEEKGKLRNVSPIDFVPVIRHED